LERADFEIVEHDVTAPRPAWSNSFNLIRVANVLNVAYFPPHQILRMVRNIASWLDVEGLLVLCRTHALDGSNHGAAYRKRGSLPAFEQVQRFGDGHELAADIEQALSHQGGRIEPDHGCGSRRAVELASKFEHVV
jgi:hypothetical protein